LETLVTGVAMGRPVLDTYVWTAKGFRDSKARRYTWHDVRGRVLIFYAAR